MKRILVVDDDPAVRKLVREVLQGHYTVEVATNGQEALDSIHCRQPDAVVLDMMMPVMDGWAFLRACRQAPYCSEVPVLAVSGEPSACEDGRRLGARACLTKPFDVNVLSDAVDHLFVVEAPKIMAATD
jgi:two-component system, chemotaxis family, chemotaxis protein CheY